MLVPMDLPSRIFLSPHPDDIAYSCYASLCNPPAPRTDAIQIVTVFSVSVRANGELGQRKSQEEITRVRQMEDQNFASGEGVRLMSLGFPDSSVRGETNRGLELAIDDATKHPMFKSVKASLAKSIGSAIGYASIYIPLGIGNHVDHRMVRDAMRSLALESNIPGALAGLRYYEDLPYAAFVEEHEIRRLAKRVISPTPTSYVVRLENFWVRKSRAVRNYVSQLSPVVLKAFADHSSAVSNSEFPGEERLWIADPDATAPAVDISAWVTLEAAHRIGDYTTIFGNSFANPHYQTSIGRTILMGPMYSPNVRPRHGPLEDIQTIASSLGSYILYPPQVSNGWGLKKRMHTLLRDIETRYGISIFYLRDREQEHQVDRVLFDISAVLDHRGLYEPALQGFLRDLKRRMNISVDVDVRQYAASLREWAGSEPPSQEGREFAWSGNQWDPDSGCDEGTRDSVLGLLLALPVQDVLRGLTQPDETAVLVATDSVSLPSAFAAKMQSEMYAVNKGPVIKTLFYCADVAPIRKLITGADSPNVPTLDAVGGFDWEGPVRSLINFSLEHAPIDEQGMPILRRYFHDFEPFRHFSSQTDLRLMAQAWRLDAVGAASANIRDELLFFNRTFALRGEIPIIAPGIPSIPCLAESKERSRRKLLSYARMVWSFADLDPENTLVATQIALNPNPGSLLRTYNLLATLSTHLPASKKILLLIVCRYDESRRSEFRSADELLTHMSSLSTPTPQQHQYPNLRVRVINQPLWPQISERNLRPTNLDRNDLFRATDFSICLDAYNPFSTTALTPIACGAVAVLSTGCGAHRRLLELGPAPKAENGNEEPGHVVVVDYAASWTASITAAREGDMPGIVEDLFEITLEERVELERECGEKLAPRLLGLVPWTSAQRAERVRSGGELAARLGWEEQFSSPMVGVLKNLYDDGSKA